MAENRKCFYTLHLYLTPPQGGGRLFRPNFAKVFDTQKSRMIKLPCCEKTVTMLSRFGIIAECDGQTDRRIERIPISIKSNKFCQKIKCNKSMLRYFNISVS